jgi:hypothetical protein
MKHLLNNLGEEEKNSIREQHAGGMKINTEKFGKLVEAKQGDVKQYTSMRVNESVEDPNLEMNKTYDKMVKREKIVEERSEVDKEMILSLILKYAAYFGKENFDDAYDWMENVVGTVEDELMKMGVDQEIVDSLREDYDDLLLAYWEA